MNQRSRIAGVLSTAGLLVVLTVAGASAAVLLNPWAFATIARSPAMLHADPAVSAID
jgi:hypothetical protein